MISEMIEIHWLNESIQEMMEFSTPSLKTHWISIIVNLNQIKFISVLSLNEFNYIFGRLVHESDIRLKLVSV